MTPRGCRAPVPRTLDEWRGSAPDDERPPSSSRGRRAPRASAAALLALLAPPVPAQGTCPEGQRPFSHHAGEACIPERPQRIVALRHDSITTPLLELGAPVVGTGAYTDGSGETYIPGATDILGVRIGDEGAPASVGLANAPDLEAVAALGPDLILAPDWQADLHDRLSAIAPTVIVPPQDDALAIIGLVADAAGVEEAFDARAARYRERVEQVRSLLGDPSRITVGRFGVDAGGPYFYPDWGAFEQAIRDVGFASPPLYADLGEGGTISWERLPEFDADLLFTGYSTRLAEETVAASVARMDEQAAFWRGLPAVVRGDHFWYPYDLWVTPSFSALHAALDGLLLGVQGRVVAD